MAKIDEVLTAVKTMNIKLYGENGFEGDIPEMKKDTKCIIKHLEDHSKRITILEVERKPSKKLIAGSASGIVGIISLVFLNIGQILGWWQLGG